MTARLASDACEVLLARIDRALAGRSLGTWETRFLQDMRNKLGRASPNLSEKQWRKLHDVLSRSDHPIRRLLPGYSRRGYGLRRRRARGMGHVLRRDLALALILAVMFGVYQLSIVLAPRLATGTGVLPSVDSTSSGSSTDVPGTIRVIDGDTVDVRGEHFRLVGLNTPETFEPRCAAELELGTRAKDRLRGLLATGTARLTKVPCACPPGTEGTKRCNYGRSCGVLAVNGTDVAETLVGEGLAVAFHCGTTGCPRLPRPWCG